MFTRHDNAGYRKSLPGIRQKTLAYGEKTLTVEHLCGALQARFMRIMARRTRCDGRLL